MHPVYSQNVFSSLQPPAPDGLFRQRDVEVKSFFIIHLIKVRKKMIKEERYDDHVFMCA